MLGAMASVLSSMACMGCSRPVISSAPRMAGRNSRITSQKATLPALWLTGAMPASALRRSSRRVAFRALLTPILISVATTQATRPITPAAKMRGR